MEQTVVLDEQSEQFVEEQIAAGRYASRSDVVRKALRIMAAREAAERRVLAALQEGLDSGLSTATVEDIWAEALDRYQRRNA